LKRAFREGSQSRCLKYLTEWLVGYFLAVESRSMREHELSHILGSEHAWKTALGVTPERFLLEPKTISNGVQAQRETPLGKDDLWIIESGQGDTIAITNNLIKRRQPRWLIGWRDICRTTDERTLIAAVFPTYPMSHTAPLLFTTQNAKYASALIASLSSLALDYIARQKVGGTHMTLGYLQQLPLPDPSNFSVSDLAFISKRVLELTYTSYSMRPWAEDLGYSGAPFAWNEDRRSQLRAELDAYLAAKYGLTRDELRYVLNPADVKGPEYPSETFRVLKSKEESRLGEYRTGRLVLDAWDRLAESSFGTQPVEVRPETAAPRRLRDGAWARPMPAGPGDAGAMLAAILKAMAGPMPARQVRLAATFGLEPRLLLPHLNPNQAAEWQRLIGAEAAPLTGNAASFAPRVDRTWGSAVTAHRGNGRLVENLTAGTWAPGPGLDAIDTAGWPDGRAGMLMHVLPHFATDAVISAMPAEIRGWIDAAAA
jgi:hypothetical protein